MHTKLRGIVAATALLGIAAAGLTGCAGTARGSGEPLVGLVIKTQDNPFYVTMADAAKAQAKKNGLDLQLAAGSGQSDVDSQIKAIENFTAQGAKAILVTPAGDDIIPAIKKAQQAGVLVFALDSPLSKDSGIDGTFATDNTQAGVLIGQWAAAYLGSEDARIATLDLSTDQIPVDVQRNQGFLDGFGVDVADPAKMWDETDSRLSGHEVTDANEAGGRSGMEALIQKDRAINLAYTINEPTAAGAFQAVVAAGLDDQVTIVSIDGGCPGVKNVQNGVIAATSMQFPKKMAQDALDAVKTFLDTGEKPENSPGLEFTNTGVTLITDTPQDGIESEDTAWGLQECWG
jgi:fructose transport system substrate-binding protein